MLPNHTSKAFLPADDRLVSHALALDWAANMSITSPHGSSMVYPKDQLSLLMDSPRVALSVFVKLPSSGDLDKCLHLKSGLSWPQLPLATCRAGHVR